jgi:DNA-binding transcriptional LysR family regulator
MIDKLEAFIVLAREGHFGRAAETMGVTQPTLSSAIRALEDQLGVQLVFRGSRFKGLTPEGQRALTWARRIVGDARSLKDDMRSARSGLSGDLRLGVIPTALPMVARLTAPLLNRHPGLKVTIRSHTSAEILTGIETLELDAGLTYLETLPQGRVVQVPLYAETYRLLCRADAPVAARAEIAWAEVAALPLCLLTTDMQNRRIVETHLAEAGVVVAPTVESNSTVALIAHVLTGGWCSVVPADMAAMVSGDARLAAVPIVAPAAAHVVGLIAARHDPQTPMLEALLAQATAVAV